jgi:hypothetical protein
MSNVRLSSWASNVQSARVPAPSAWGAIRNCWPFSEIEKSWSRWGGQSTVK